MMEGLEREYAQVAVATRDFYAENPIYAFREPSENEKILETAVETRIFTPPNPKQKQLLDGWLDNNKKVFTFTGGNRMGKTTILTIIGICVLAGQWLWDGTKISFIHKKPRKVRLVGQGWESHIKAVVIPALKRWWPKNRPLKTSKNNQGVESVWIDVLTGSTIEIMSNSQESDMFEGWDGDLVLYDEPPRRDIRVACARGLIDREGRELFGATLIKEAWIHREVIKARDENGKPDMSVCNVTGEIYDNLGYGLTQAGIDQFAKTLKPEERLARLHGKPSYMSTLVFPRFDREKHVKEPFKIPLDWIVDISIDFHPSKPWAVVFMATARNNFKYVINEIHSHGNPKFIAEEIVRYVQEKKLRVGIVQIDPLAKGDRNNDNTVYEIVAEVLGSHGLTLDVASKDKDNGIALVNNLLWTENEMPGLYFCENCVQTIRQTEDLMYDPDSLRPTAVKVDDDFTECLYRLALIDTQWYPPVAYDASAQPNVML